MSKNTPYNVNVNIFLISAATEGRQCKNMSVFFHDKINLKSLLTIYVVIQREKVNRNLKYILSYVRNLTF